MEKSGYQPKRFAVVGAGPVGAIVAAFLAKGGYDVTLCDVVPSLLRPAWIPHPHRGDRHPLAKVAQTTTRVDDLTGIPPSRDRGGQGHRPSADPPPPSRGSSPKGDTSSAGRTASTPSGSSRSTWAPAPCCGPSSSRLRPLGRPRPDRLPPPPPTTSRSSTPYRGTPPSDCEAFTACGLDTSHTFQIQDMVWRKAVLNACMTRSAPSPERRWRGDQRSDPLPPGRRPHQGGGRRRQGNEYRLGSNFYPYCIDYIRNAGHHKPSCSRDIEAGRRTEVDYINGKSSSTAPRPASPPRTAR